MPASNLIERVAALAADGRAGVPESVQATIEDLLVRLREPVRVAVVGPVNSGKSTIVNALLGQRVAPTDVSECTKLVAWFRYGRPQRVDVQLQDGGTVTAQLEADGTLPRELPVPVGRVRALHCYLANETLRTLTLIDTPGIGSVHGNISRSTTELLGLAHDSTEAAGRADAVVFLFSQVMMADELKALELFHSEAAARAERSAANAVGLLSHADQLGDGSRDAWTVALELATSYAGRFRQQVATVVPVIGLLAETAEAAMLTETDVNDLAALGGLEERALRRLLWSTDRFVSTDAPVPSERRERLLTLLDLYGITRAVDILRTGTTGAVAVRRELSRLSGIASVKLTLDTHFREQDHVLKVRSALETLDRVTFGAPPGSPLARLRDDVEALRIDPEMHAVAELEAWHDCCSGKVTFTPAVVEEIGRLFRPGTAAARLGVANDRGSMTDAAKDGLVRWQRFMSTEATPAQASVGRVVRRSYQLIWTGLQRAENTDE